MDSGNRQVKMLDPDEVIIKFDPLVHKLAHRFSRVAPQLSHEDLVQEGRIGLLKAIETYNPSFNTTFMTWAYYKIMGEITTRCKRFNRKITHSLPMWHEDPEPFFLAELEIKSLLEDFLTNNRSKEIVKYRFGLLGYPELTRSQIAEKFRVPITKVDSILYQFKRSVKSRRPDLARFIK